MKPFEKRTSKKIKKFNLLFPEKSRRMCCWILVLLLAIFPKYVDTDIAFIASPPAINYVECGQDITFGWQYDTTYTLKIINWYQLTTSGTNIEEKIAFFETGSFTHVSSADYPPAKENRITFIANAGLKIVNVKPSDAATIRIEVIFATADPKESKDSTEFQIIVLPKVAGTPLQSSITVSKGDANTQLVCAFEGKPTPTVLWKKDSTELANGVGKFSYSEATSTGSAECGSEILTSTLTITSPDETVIGTYSCTANVTTSQSSYLDQTTNLIVQYAPSDNTSSFTVSQSEITAGEQVIFTCRGNGVPTPTYQILFDGNTIASGAGNNGQFSLTYKVGDHDDGIYSCLISNSVGSYTRNISLVVNIAPQFWDKPNSVYEVETGSAVNITCGMFGDPFHEDNVTWTKQGGGGSFSESKSTTFSNETITYISNSLIISSAQLSDFGNYTCSGPNKDKIDEQTKLILRVKSAPDIERMNLIADPTIKDEHSEMNLECSAKGYPKPVITWQLNGTVVALQGKEESTTEIDNGIITVSQKGKFTVTRSNAGIAGCYASNGVSPDKSSTTKLVINYVPTTDLSVHHNKTLFNLNDINTFQASLNETILLICEVSSFPASQITWRKNGNDVTSSLSGSITSVENSTDYEIRTVQTLELSSVQTTDNEDQYKCQASNAQGTSEQTVKILVLYGFWVKRPTNVTYGAIGLSTFLDWQYYYTQPYQLINWKDGSDINSNTIGSLNSAGSANLRANNDYDRNTKSGFYIQNTQLQDEGWYGIAITFQNSPEVLQDAVYVSVIRNPHSTIIQPKDPAVIQYSDVSLTCTSIGKPAPDLKWFKGNDMVTQLSNTTDLYITTSSSANGGEFQSVSTLTLQNVSFDAAVRYTCLADGMLANETRTSTVILYYAPLNTTLTANTNPILKGSTLILTCVTTATPSNVYYAFYHNGVLLQNSTSQQLTLANIDNWLAGSYECLPVNMVGNGTTATMAVTVRVPPFIYETNNPYYVEENSNADLICRAYGNPKPDIYWRKVSGPTGSTDNLSPTTVDDFTNSTLFGVNSTGAITGVTKQDQGIYECLANSTLGEHKINITIAVQLGAKITNTSLDGIQRNFTSGDSNLEWCIAEGLPKPEIRWTLDGQPVLRHRITSYEISNTIDLVAVGSYININDMDHNDNGVLMCTAVNNIASASNSSTYSVLYPPKLSSHPKSVEGADISGRLQLSCVANSKEIASISWEKDGVVLSTGGSVTITESTNVNLDQISSTLVVQPVIESTLGNYICNATNSLGSVTDTTSVTIYSGAKIVSFPSNALSVRENTKNYNIICVATGTPIPEIIWYFAGSAISFPSGSFQRSQTQNTSHITSTLTIGDVTKNQYGDYKCEAKNLNSIQSVKTDSASTTLVVQHDPEFVTGFPVASYTVENYENITITCRVHASPQANIYIFPPDGVTMDSRFSLNTESVAAAQTIVTETNLTITNVTKYDYGMYHCFANNTFNSVFTKPLLNILYPPSGNTTADITFNENGNLALEKTIASNPFSSAQFWYEGNTLSIAGVSTTSNDAGAAQYGGKNLNVKIQSSSAKRSMSGKYEIITCNSLGCRSDVWNVIVYYAPELESSSSDATQLVGTQIVFQCVFTVNPSKSPVLVTWQKGTATLTNGNNVNIEETSVKNSDLKYTVTSRLTLSSIDINTGGDYKCLAENVVGSNSSTVTLTVHHPPIITSDLSTTPNRLNEGATLPLAVTVQASPQANFSWYRNGVDMLTSTDTVTGSNEQRSQVTATANSQSSGIYYVKSCNQYGCVMSKNATLIVEFKPVVTSLLDQEVVENQTKSLECVMSAEPQVQSVSWYLNDTTLVSNNAHITIDALTHTNKVYTTESVSKITFKDSQRDLHAGKYTCKAVNSKGETSADGKLIVEYPVRLVSDISNVTVIEGNTLQLAISVRSNPIANFKWTHEGDAIDKIYNFTYTFNHKAVYDYYKNELLTLIGQYVTPARGGWYEVDVGNQVGDSIFRRAYVRVIWPGKFDVPPSTTHANLGDTATLTCRVQAYPEPTLTWERSPSQAISSDKYTHVVVANSGKSTTVESVLTLTNLQESDFTDFTCKATNDAGVTSASALMNVRFPPRLLVQNANIEIEKGHTLNLSCSNAANPVASQEWKKEGVDLAPNGVYYTTVATDCVAVEGTYSCTPKNSIGSGSTVQYVVTCIAPPSVTLAASCVTSDSTTTCQCNGTGYPPPDIYWQKFGGSTILSTGNSVKVAKDESSDGTYICKINNTAGSVTTVAAITAFGPLTGDWGEWGACGPSCSTNGTRTRNRACNEDICYDSLTDSQACQATCSENGIPTMNGAEDEPLIALYILGPLIVVLLVFGAVALAQKNALINTPTDVIPIYRSPAFQYNAMNGTGVPRVSQDVPLQETIEVNVPFADEDEGNFPNDQNTASPQTTGTLTSDDMSAISDDDEQIQYINTASPDFKVDD